MGCIQPESRALMGKSDKEILSAEVKKLKDKDDQFKNLCLEMYYGVIYKKNLRLLNSVKKPRCGARMEIQLQKILGINRTICYYRQNGKVEKKQYAGDVQHPAAL
jgi:hypothetical protein